MARKVDKEGTQKRKEQILQAAYSCFVKKGFHKSSMADICKKAKLSPGTVYHYFGSKDEIILHFAQLELDSAMEFVEAMKEVHTIDDMVALCVDGVLYETESTDPQLYIEVICEGGRNLKVGSILMKADEVILKSIQKTLTWLSVPTNNPSAKVLSNYIGGQMMFLELYKMEKPSDKDILQMSALCKKGIRHILLELVEEGKS
ncbi:MAG: TetR/AcrR family transcriptional regulator [Desulfovibrio sp.]